jgi:acetyl-CoA carboxylase biotin carboxyl carrier protein
VDAKELRDLIELISKSNFVSFELEREGFKLKLEKSGGTGSPAIVVAAPAAVPSLPLPGPVAAASRDAAAETRMAAPPAAAPAAAPASNLVDVKSPIVGTFFRQPSPTAPPFVEPGTRVKKGQVLCIIEAMKLMNEIEAEMDAEVVEIPVANGQPVEFGEVLFRLRPMAS